VVDPEHPAAPLDPEAMRWWVDDAEAGVGRSVPSTRCSPARTRSRWSTPLEGPSPFASSGPSRSSSQRSRPLTHRRRWTRSPTDAHDSRIDVRPCSNATSRVAAAAAAAGLGHIAPHDLRRSVCSLAARRHVDPVAAAEVTGHSLVVWATSYARSYGRDQRREARDRLLAHGFGAVADDGFAATALPSEPPSVVAETHDDEKSLHVDDGRTWDRTRERSQPGSGRCGSSHPRDPLFANSPAGWSRRISGRRSRGNEPFAPQAVAGVCRSSSL
jgi:hypothetical protein